MRRRQKVLLHVQPGIQQTKLVSYFINDKAAFRSYLSSVRMQSYESISREQNQLY